MRTKTHLTIGCGRGKNTTTDVYRVTCLSCQGTEAYAAAKEVADAEREARFLAQTPRQVREPWREGIITCRECGGDLFRYKGRTCYGHYEDYQCVCGHVESRLTETGMSF